MRRLHRVGRLPMMMMMMTCRPPPPSPVGVCVQCTVYGSAYRSLARWSVTDVRLGVSPDWRSLYGNDRPLTAPYTSRQDRASINPHTVSPCRWRCHRPRREAAVAACRRPIVAGDNGPATSRGDPARPPAASPPLAAPHTPEGGSATPLGVIDLRPRRQPAGTREPTRMRGTHGRTHGRTDAWTNAWTNARMIS